MDKNNMTLIRVAEEIVDITLLPILRLVPADNGKIIVKRLPTMPVELCSKNHCQDYATRLMQFIGNDLTFHHQFVCDKHEDDVLESLEVEVFKPRLS